MNEQNTTEWDELEKKRKRLKTKGTLEWAKSNINFCSGCKNDCLYCYAASMANRHKRILREDWHKMKILPDKANLHPTFRTGWIMSPSSHDLFEENVDLAIEVFKNILAPGNNLLIVTKPRYKVIKKLCKALMNYQHQIIFRFTITTGKDATREYWEPNAPRIRERIDALAYAYAAGYQTSVSIEPYLDIYVRQLVILVNKYVTESIWIGPMNFAHVPKKYITGHVRKLYSPEILKQIKTEVDELDNSKVKYKDHFLNKMED